MAKRRRGNSFYVRLAWTNVFKNRLVYLPQFIATAIISGVFLLICGLVFSKGLQGVPAGETAKVIFSLGMVVFAIFAFCFMVYINNFLIGRRKKEFGLYGILGLEKRHVGRVLVWENLFVLGAGVLGGVIVALVFGRLLFLLLLRLLHMSPDNVFSLAPASFLITGGLFFLIFAFTSLLNLRQVRMSSPIALMQSERRGEKDSPLLWPVAVLGVAALGVAYYYAWSIVSAGVAMGVFFLLAILVIFATNALFRAGSIVALKCLRANKRYYYKLSHFVTVSGLMQRMKQNARSLATICVLSTMLVVTVSGTLSLYLGSEEMIEGMYPYDVEVHLYDAMTEDEIGRFVNLLPDLAAKNNVTLSADRNKILFRSQIPQARFEQEAYRNNVVPDGFAVTSAGPTLRTESDLVFDVLGEQADGLAFMKDVRTLYNDTFSGLPNFHMSDVFTAREDGYGTYGGLMFLGLFFGLLFLAVAVLIIYFKQITEGFEDRERFAILQKVGMDDAQVKDTINRQVLWVFFLPLGTTVLHMVFASRIMSRMLQVFMLYDWGLVLTCIGGTCALFVLLYFAVYRMTARVYYRIVRR